MLLRRRPLLSLAALLTLPGAARAADDDPRETERGLGHPDAKVTVHEFFSLTCTHCADFSTRTMPEVTKNLIDSGQLRFVYHDFPLDQIALLAAMVARWLPAERYEPFCAALFASQDRWAFAHEANHTEEIWKRAALAGMDRATFDKAITDTGLKTWIIQTQADDQKAHGIDSTPTFIVNDRKRAGAMSYDDFVKFIQGSGT